MRKLRNGILWAGMMGLPLAVGACVNVHVDPLEVKPITLNVNLRVVDKQLDDFFSFEDQYQGKTSATTQAVGSR